MRAGLRIVEYPVPLIYLDEERSFGGSLDDAVRAYAAPGRYDAAMGRYRALPRDAARNRADPRPLAVPATALEGGAPGISAATLPGADVVVVPGAGHYVQEDRPYEVAAAIRAIAARRS